MSISTARRKLGKPTVCVRGAPRQPPRTQPRSPHHDRSVGPWGGAERRNTKDEHAMLLDYRAVMPLAAAGPAKSSLRFAHCLWTHWRQAVVISTVRCQLRAPFLNPEATCGKAGLRRRREGLELTDAQGRADLKMTDCELGRAMVNRSRGRRARQAECR